MTWQPMRGAPKTCGDYFPPMHFGPWIVLSDGDRREVLARWRATSGPTDALIPSGILPDGWEGEDHALIQFAPQRWRHTS